MEAKYYETVGEGAVRCLLCSHRCRIPPGKAGLCRIRVNRMGRLEAAGYGRAVSLSMDPIEKKPLYHFHPGRLILSTGPNGCNLDCQFCQNWEISQREVPTEYLDPGELAEMAASQGSIGVAYTYTEPFIWFEYLLDACRAVRNKGLVNVLVTNGTVNREPLEELIPLVDAMNIDLKSMDVGFYKKVCRGDLETVLETIRASCGRCHIELTNLVIPGMNDTDGDLERLVKFIGGLDPMIPLHISRYFPRYRAKTPPTPEETLLKFQHLAAQELAYVYLGNINLPGGEDTRCPECGSLLIERRGYRPVIVGMHKQRCRRCGRRADVIGLEE